MGELTIVHAEGDPYRRGVTIGRALADGHARSVEFTRRYTRRHGLADRISSLCLPPTSPQPSEAVPRLVSQLEGIARAAAAVSRRVRGQRLRGALRRARALGTAASRRLHCAGAATDTGRAMHRLRGSGSRYHDPGAQRAVVRRRRRRRRHDRRAPGLRRGGRDRGTGRCRDAAARGDERARRRTRADVALRYRRAGRRARARSSAATAWRRSIAPTPGAGPPARTVQVATATCTRSGAATRSPSRSRRRETRLTRCQSIPTMPSIRGGPQVAEAPSDGSLSRFARACALADRRPPQTADDVMRMLGDHGAEGQDICVHPDPTEAMRARPSSSRWCAMSRRA